MLICISLALSLHLLYTKSVLAAASLLLTCIIIPLYFYKKDSKTNTKVELDEVLKISTIINESASDVANHLNNYTAYKEWNKHLIGITDFKKDENSATYSYFKTINEEGDIQLKIKRKKKSQKKLS